MKRRKWDSKSKAKIVLEGLSGMSVLEVCTKHQISQNQYYLWRDKFLSESYRAFETVGNVNKEDRLKKRILNLEQTLGTVTFESSRSKPLWFRH